ncbi:MAG: cell wall-associated NlpC family hydrolase [Chlamydiales bacterium]|jgi:cell wall-associated NlpC family hydrolase
MGTRMILTILTKNKSLIFYFCKNILRWVNYRLLSEYISGEIMNNSEVWQVSVPLADLRREPTERTSSITERDLLQETQCLYGERLIVQEEQGAWVRVTAPEQVKLSPLGTWEGYPGWVQKKHVCENVGAKTSNLIVKAPWASINTKSGATIELPMSTRLHSYGTNGNNYEIILSNGEKSSVKGGDVHHINDLVRQNDIERRAAVMQAVRYCLGAPYFWGGRGVYYDDTETKSSVDCSGLVNLAYNSCGISVPRDAHDQFLWSKRIAAEKLKSGDLVFLSESNRPGYVSHVMIYEGEGILIEATGDSNNVHRISAEERFGCKLEKLSRGCIKGNWNIFFGSFLFL